MSDTWMPMLYEISRNGKLGDAGPPAAWLYVGGLLYAHQHATDGVLTRSVLPTLAVGFSTRTLNLAVKNLVDSGLWEHEPDGFYVHDWDEYHAPAEHLKDRRNSQNKRKAASRSRSGHTVTSLPRPA